MSLVSFGYLGGASADHTLHSLWSRLIAHFWSLEIEGASYSSTSPPNPVTYLQTAYELTKQATSSPNEWHGTTTACGALLGADNEQPDHPLLYVTQLGDSQILVIRPSSKEVTYHGTGNM